jgi:hypothetical protein
VMRAVAHANLGQCFAGAFGAPHGGDTRINQG